MVTKNTSDRLTGELPHQKPWLLTQQPVLEIYNSHNTSDAQNCSEKEERTSGYFHSP